MNGPVGLKLATAMSEPSHCYRCIMARHPSVSRKDRNAAAKRQQIGDNLAKMFGEQKSLKFKDYDRLLADATHDMGLRCRLSDTATKGGEAAIVARRRLVQLRDVKYYVDKPVAAGDLYQNELKPNRKVK